MRSSFFRFPFAAISLLTLLTCQGCATQYLLKATSENPEKLNGIEIETLVTNGCVFQAGSQNSNSDEMLVRTRITNKSEKAFEVEPTAYAMIGDADTLKNSPLLSQDPEIYVRDLTSSAELYESRTKMETYQGLAELESLKGEAADKTLDAAKTDLKSKEKEAAQSREIAENIRNRLKPLTGALKRSSLKPGETVEGLLIFKASFLAKGDITLESRKAPCEGKLFFHLKK